MADLYRRLRPLGFSPSFLRAVVLPDWWEDSLADIPLNRAMAEASIGRYLGASLNHLRDKDALLSLPDPPRVQLKTATIGTTARQVLPSIRIAQRFADLLISACPHLPPVSLPVAALSLRQQILAEGRSVDLSALVDCCWASGIVVAQLDQLPQSPGFRKFDGLVMFAGERPCVFLGDKKDAPPALAFFLAHELGHLCLRHVTPGSDLLADDTLETVIQDEFETAADRFACELLTGHPEPQLSAIYGLTGERLASSAQRAGRAKQIDAGVLTLIYGRSASRWGAAWKALKILGLDKGARSILNEALLARVELDLLAESDRHFVEALALKPCPVS